jgi:hypothetical protein
MRGTLTSSAWNYQCVGGHDSIEYEECVPLYNCLCSLVLTVDLVAEGQIGF